MTVAGVVVVGVVIVRTVVVVVVLCPPPKIVVFLGPDDRAAEHELGAGQEERGDREADDARDEPEDQPGAAARAALAVLLPEAERVVAALA